MELYSESLISSIAQNDIEDEIRKFFYQMLEIPEMGKVQFRDILGYKGRDFSDFVGVVLNEKLKGKVEKEELRDEFKKIQKNSLIKRKNFTGHIEKKTYLLPSKETSPLYKKNLVNISDIETARNEIILELTEWAESEKKYIDCPYFNYASISMMKKGYISDILNSLWRKLKTNSFNGSFNDYYVSIHKDFIDKPFFSPSSILPELTEFFLEDGEKKRGVLIRDEKGDVISQLVFDGDPSVRVPVFSNDAKIMLMSFSKYIPDATQFLLDRTITVSRKELAKLFKTNLTPYTYQRVDKVIDELLFWTYYEKKYAFHLVESRELNDDIYKIVFTGVGAKELVERTMIELRREDYNALENRLAKILCHFIRYRQLSLYPYQTEYIEITYHDFLRNAHFPSEDMEINIKFIEDALKDFVTHNLFIYDYKTKGTSFFIKFIEPANYDIDRFRRLFPV